MKVYKSQDTIPNVANEPSVLLQFDNKYQKMHSVLGGSKLISIPIESEMDLILLTRKGIPKSVLITLCKLLDIPLEKMSQLLHVSLRTIQRKTDKDLLNSYTSEQILEIAEVITKGIDIFGSVEAFNVWMQSDLTALNGKKPLDFLDTSFGTDMLLAILGRLEYGVY
jgi:putative toxin-antitoxin system antitoxin component (TIGR02293 family)